MTQRSPGGVQVALADLTGDGTPDLITAPGPGMPAEVKIFDGSSGQQVSSFTTFDGFTGGVRIAAGEIAEGTMGIAVAAGSGSAPIVRWFTVQGQQVGELVAYDPAFTGGVEVALGETPEGTPALVTAAASQGGPHVKVFDALTGQVRQSFFAYEETFTGGVRLSVGDVTGDGVEDIITGAGKGGAPQVRIFDGFSGVEVEGFFADDSTLRNGVEPAWI